MYTELIPNNWAAQYIEAYWIQSNSFKNEINVTVLPDGCTDIILLFNNNRCKQLVVGCMTRPKVVYLKPSELMFGIRFKPGCAIPFLNISIKEITDKTVSLMEIRDFDINSITPDLISYKKDLIHDIVEKKLKKLFLEKKFDRTVYLTANFIKQNQGLKSIDDVAHIIGVSRRHLERKFIDSVGISPKLYSRIIRFHYADKMLNTINVDSLISIALDSGYYDQAHFYRDYKEFSGTTPSRNKNLSHFYNTTFNL